MKRIILFIFILSLLFLTACKKDTDISASPSGSIPSSPTQGTDGPVSPTSLPDATVFPTLSPTPISSDQLRPLKGVINVNSDGDSQAVDAELIYQNLNTSNPFLAFSIYSDTKSYTLKYDDPVYRFSSASGDAELCYLEISYIKGIDADGLKPSFADKYIDFTDITFESFSKVGEENMECTAITAFNSKQYLEAYLINVEYGVAAVVLSSKSDSDNDANKLSAMLDTLVLHEK